MGLSETEIHERVVEALTYVGLDESYYEMSPFELSGGQKRRVAIAGVLAMRPKTLILDEPAAGLDPAGRAEILTQVKALYLKSKMTVILVSHSMEDVARIASRIIVMNQGTIAMDGRVSEIFSRAEELKKIGLDVPQVSALAQELIKRGIKLDSNIYTIERAKAAIMLLAKEKRGAEEC
jgi:energy-coupling factor transport system ATP-binding protein